MSRVFVSSITELCRADHNGDPAIVARWTANKDPESLMRWFANSDNRLFVAEDDGAVVAVGSFNGSEIQCNYVTPERRFTGVSKALMAHMESRMRAGGVRRATLTSSQTAHRFYRSLGWRDDGAPLQKFGVAHVYPMSKTLA